MHDYLHNIFLGTGRDLLASGIRVLLLNGLYDQPGVSDVDQKLSLLHAEMQKTCRTNGLLGWLPCEFLADFPLFSPNIFRPRTLV